MNKQEKIDRKIKKLEEKKQKVALSSVAPNQEGIADRKKKKKLVIEIICVILSFIVLVEVCVLNYLGLLTRLFE